MDSTIPSPFLTTSLSSPRSYGKKPSKLKIQELVNLLHVSNYCGAIASKIHAEEILSTKIDKSNCAMLGDLSCTLVYPLLLQNCGRVFVANPAEVMKSEGWKTAQSNNDLTRYFLEEKCEIANPKKHSIAKLRIDLMKAGCELVDLDGDLVTLEKNLKRLTAPPAPQSRR
jgi:hypothetical protein